MLWCLIIGQTGRRTYWAITYLMQMNLIEWKVHYCIESYFHKSAWKSGLINYFWYYYHQKRYKCLATAFSGAFKQLYQYPKSAKMQRFIIVILFVKKYRQYYYIKLILIKIEWNEEYKTIFDDLLNFRVNSSRL